MKIVFGVSRTVVRFSPDDDPDLDMESHVVETQSNQWALVAVGPDDTEPVEIVIYTIDSGRLRALLTAAAGGADVDALMFDVDAAALIAEEADLPYLEGPDGQGPPA